MKIVNTLTLIKFSPIKILCDVNYIQARGDKLDLYYLILSNCTEKVDLVIRWNSYLIFIAKSI